VIVVTAGWFQQSCLILFYFIYFIYLIYQTKDPKVTNMSHSNESVLTQREPVRYTNKLIKKRIPAVTKKSTILANTTMSDTRGQELKGGV